MLARGLTLVGVTVFIIIASSAVMAQQAFHDGISRTQSTGSATP